MNEFDPHNAAPAFAATRIAYTLNNTQPVRCTYISEEPLFYLDQAITDEADMDFPFDLENEFLASTDQPTDTPLEGVDAGRIFAEQFAPGATYSVSINDTIATLCKSRMGAALYEFARNHGGTVEVADQLEAISYDRMSGAITVRPGLMAAEQLLLVVRELRRVWQHRNGALIHPLLFHPDHAIVINRVHAADLFAMMVRIGWELRLAGDDSLWTHLEQNGHDDLTRPFAREALADFRSLNNGRAMAAVFEAWFISERCRGYDRTLIQQMLADYQGYVFKAGHEETSKVLTQQLLASLGTLPFGKNYLSPHAATILADPIFTDIRDRSNANFLWFIKFEQSFRQTERDLQNEGKLPPSGSQFSDPSSVKDRSAHAATSATAQVLRLPVAEKAPRRRPAKRTIAANAAVIIDLQDWRRRRAAE